MLPAVARTTIPAAVLAVLRAMMGLSCVRPLVQPGGMVGQILAVGKLANGVVVKRGGKVTQYGR